MKKNVFISCLFLTALLLGTSCSTGPDDSAIETSIKAKMFSDPDLKGTLLDVNVQDGEVTLSGEMPSAEVQIKAYRLAGSVEGVTKVIDQMKIAIVEAEEVEQPQTPAVVPPTEFQPKPRVNEPPPISPQRAEASLPPPRKQDPQPVLESTRKRVAETRRQTPKTPPPAKPKTVFVEIPAGTPISIRMVDTIDSSVHDVGEVFRATLEVPIVVEGQEVIPTKTALFVELIEAQKAGRIRGRSELELQLHSLEFGGKSYRLSSDSYHEVGKSRGKDTALKVGIATGIGTAIGAIAGGKKGAAIGAAVGGGAGVAVQTVTKGQQVQVPSETQLEFRLRTPVTVSYTPGK